MKQSFTAAATDSNDQVQRLRRVSFAMLGLISLALPVYIYAYVTQGDWQLLVLNIVVASVYIPAVLALYLAPRGKATLGALLLIGLLLTVIVVASTLVQGLGYPLGILAMLLPSFIALQTLPPRWIQPVILCSVALGAFTMLYQLFGVQFGVEYALIRSFVPAITAIAIAGFGYLLLRDYGNFQLRNKLLSAFLVVAIIPIALIAVVVLRSTRLTLVAKEADALAAGAQQTRSEVDAFVENARDTIEALSQVPQAAEYLLLSAIQRPGSDGDRDLRVLFNLVKAQNQENISSFALIDLQGQKVFDTSPTSSDESVGQALYFTQPLQTGRPYASPMLFSAATGQPYLYFSSVVRDPANQTVIGVLRVRYRAGALQDVVEQTVGLAGNDSSAIVVDENGLILAHAEFPNLTFKLLGALDSTKQAQLQAQRLLPYDGSAAPLTGFQTLRQGLENAEQSPVFTAGVSGGSTSNNQGETETYAVIDSQTQSWTVLFHQSADVLAAPLVALERQIVVIALAIAALVALVALLLARRLSTPIVRLTALSALIKQGDLAVQAPVTSTDEIGALSGAFNSMTDQLRTTLAGLQQRTVALETSGQVSRRLSSILNPATLTLEVVEQLRGAFNYYHAHIYLFNEAKDTLTMAGGTGRAGRIMLANNHSIPSGRGLVGRAAATRNAVLVPDVSLADGWLANPLLPDTKAEVAVPIMLGDEVLGVLDVQHNIVNGLSHEDAVLVQSIADQVAVGLENARSFERITAVQESLRLRDRAITATRDGIIISDPNQHDMPIVYVNAGFERMTGYTPAEVLGRNCRFLQGDDTNQSEIARLRLALRDKQACRVTLRNYRKDGSMFWNELDVSPVYDDAGNLINFIGVQKDVTERIEASQQLQQSLTLQSTVLNSAPYSIISTDLEGNIQSFNNTAEATLGYRVEEALGQSSLMFHDPAEVPVWFNDLLVAADLPHDTPPESILMEAAKRGVITNREMTYIRKDGTRFSVLLLITPIRSIAGEITGFIGVATDITERQLNERERERLLIESTTQQRMLQAILDNLPVGVFSVNAIGSPQIANKAATLMLGQGIDPNASPDSYSEVYQVYHPDSDEVFPSQQLPLSQTLMTGAIASGEVDIVRVDDRIRIEVIAVPIFDQAGTLTSALTLFQDVTERRLNERERERLLRETTTQQRTLQAILDNLPVGVVSFDTVGTPQITNKAATNILGRGIDPNANPDSHTEVYQLYHSGSMTMYPPQDLPLARTLATGTIASGDVDVIRSDNERINIEVITVPIHDDRGTLTNALALFQNVTERRQNEQERERLLRETTTQQRTLQAILDNLPVGVFVVDPTGKPQLINKAATTMLGHGPTQDASPDTYSEVYQYQAFYPDSAEIYPVQELPLARTLITGTITSGEVDIVRANRNRIKLDMTAVPIFDAAGTLTSALALFQNVTERRQNEQERERLLQQVEYRALELQTVAKVSAAASSILERDELLQSVVDLTKVSFNLYQAHIYLLDDVTETLRLTVGAGEIGRAMVAEQRSIPLNREQSLVAQAARTLTAVVENNVTSNPLFLSHRLLPDTNSEMALPLVVAGRVLGVLDVQSERCDAFSAEDVQIQTTLAAQIAVALQNANLYQEQGATVQRLKELDQLKSAFLANMSHELRTPLNSILGFTEVIMEGIDGPINELIEGDLGIIHRNGQHLLTLINDILDMAKIESGKLTLHFEQFNLADVAHEAMRSLSTLATQKDLDVRVQTDLPGPTMITADRFRMRQIMLNVLGNAIKFTDQGRIVIELDATSTSNIIQVHDTGIGIPAESMEAIFTEFQQVDNSSTRKVGGTGLGLPISRHLVEMHGGSIKVQSPGKFGQGSTFRIEIPNQPALIDHAPELVTENGLAK